MAPAGSWQTVVWCSGNATQKCETEHRCCNVCMCHNASMMVVIGHYRSCTTSRPQIGSLIVLFVRLYKRLLFWNIIFTGSTRRFPTFYISPCPGLPSTGNCRNLCSPASCAICVATTPLIDLRGTLRSLLLIPHSAPVVILQQCQFTYLPLRRNGRNLMHVHWLYLAHIVLCTLAHIFTILVSHRLCISPSSCVTHNLLL